jgi:hypothetical protein
MPKQFRQTKLKQVSEFLLKRHGHSYCDACIRTALHIARPHVPEETMTANASEMGFVRNWGICFLCSKQRVITKAVVQ